MNRPIARASSLPLPGFADVSPAATPGTPAANDGTSRPRRVSPAVAMRKVTAGLAEIAQALTTMKAPARAPAPRGARRVLRAPSKPAASLGSESSGLVAQMCADVDAETSRAVADRTARVAAAARAAVSDAAMTARPAPLALRDDLALSLVADAAGGWSVEALPTTWFGLATLAVVWTAPMEGGGAQWFRESLACDGPAAVAARTSAWMERHDGPVAVMDVRALDVEVDGRTVLRLRREGDAWVSLDEATAKARLDAALARPIDAAHADAIDTAHALELQRMNAAGLPTRALDDETLRATRPVFTPSAPAVLTVRGEASESILRRDPPDARAPAPTASARPRRVSRAVERAVAELPCASGGPSREPREHTVKAARAPSDASRRGAR